MKLPVAYLLIIILAAHLAAPEAYAWTQNTLSDLGAQGLPTGWIMRAGLVGFGALVNFVLVRQALAARKIRLADVFVGLYGLAILVTGFFSTAPFLPEVPFSETEHEIHALFATLAGICLSAGILIDIFTAADSSRSRHALFLLGIVSLSAAFGLAENGGLPLGQGLVQRALWLVGFGWLVWRGA